MKQSHVFQTKSNKDRDNNNDDGDDAEQDTPSVIRHWNPDPEVCTDGGEWVFLFPPKDEEDLHAISGV